MKVITFFIFLFFNATVCIAATENEEVDSVKLIALDKCLISPPSAIDNIKTAKTESLVLGTIAAAIIGDLVKAGVNSLGEAIESASKQTNFVAEATSSFFWSSTKKSSSGLLEVTPSKKCLILYKPGNVDDIKKIVNSPSFIKLPTNNLSVVEERENAFAAFEDAGITKVPSIYVEFYIDQQREGFKIWPLLTWYNEAFKGAPKGAANAELHVYLAKPAYSDKSTDIGDLFSVARINLPKISPKESLDWNDLKNTSSLILPGRPADGFVANTLTSSNQVITQLATRRKELVIAGRELLLAEKTEKLKHSEQNENAVAAANDKVSDIKKDISSYESSVNSITKSVPIGATNIKARFIIIKEPNKFGLAVASALKAQAQPISTAAVNAIKPKEDQPEWSAANTTYVSALALVNQKQSEYSDAIAKGDATATIKSQGELSIAQAKLNEAAVALGKAIPYPSLTN